MLMNMLNPNQQQALKQFKGLNKEEQAQQLANKCNELHINKNELSQLMTMFSKLK